jgi:UDPglucose--hexose-1-phosphate uridylyltransferase
MPELRRDPINRRWVIIAIERAKRPTDFVKKENNSYSKPEICPFCEGQEHMTPPEIIAYRDANTLPNTPGWWVRVVPNRFPALAIEGDFNREGVGIYDRMNGIGAHEVIIETPHHNLQIPDMEIHQIKEIIWAYRERYLDLKNDKRFKYIMIFRNYGKTAGASLEHPHSQLIATPVVPVRVAEELKGSLDYYQQKERCIYCDILRQERSNSRERVVVETKEFLAYTPFASRFPFECTIIPKFHHSSFGSINDQECLNLATVLKEVLLRIKKALNDPPYNYLIHTSPCDDENIYRDYYHWHLDILPRLTTPAGFEWGSGFYINPTSPEAAAEYLRNVEI